jgi:hypothetical protein
MSNSGDPEIMSKNLVGEIGNALPSQPKIELFLVFAHELEF